MKITALVTSLLLAAPALAAASTPSTPSAPPASSAAPAAAAPLAIYRLDFELTTTEPGKPPTTIAFSLNVDAHHVAEATLGDNVPLAGSGGATGAPMRQNVGMKVNASFEPRGAALLLDVTTDLSTMSGPSSVHRMSTRDVALATVGQKTLVASIDHDHAHTQLSVTPSKL